MTLDITAIRSQFPALNRPAVFFDNPGGTQIAKPSLGRIKICSMPQYRVARSVP
jgi:selenocysteine lyase/cysteine desulfurase